MLVCMAGPLEFGSKWHAHAPTCLSCSIVLVTYLLIHVFRAVDLEHSYCLDTIYDICVEYYIIYTYMYLYLYVSG